MARAVRGSRKAKADAVASNAENRPEAAKSSPADAVKGVVKEIAKDAARAPLARINLQNKPRIVLKKDVSLPVKGSAGIVKRQAPSANGTPSRIELVIPDEVAARAGAGVSLQAALLPSEGQLEVTVTWPASTKRGARKVTLDPVRLAMAAPVEGMSVTDTLAATAAQITLQRVPSPLEGAPDRCVVSVGPVAEVAAGYLSRKVSNLARTTGSATSEIASPAVLASNLWALLGSKLLNNGALAAACRAPVAAAMQVLDDESLGTSSKLKLTPLQMPLTFPDADAYYRHQADTARLAVLASWAGSAEKQFGRWFSANGKATKLGEENGSSDSDDEDTPVITDDLVADLWGRLCTEAGFQWDRRQASSAPSHVAHGSAAVTQFVVHTTLTSSHNPLHVDDLVILSGRVASGDSTRAALIPALVVDVVREADGKSRLAQVQVGCDPQRLAELVPGAGSAVLLGNVRSQRLAHTGLVMALCSPSMLQGGTGSVAAVRLGDHLLNAQPAAADKKQGVFKAPSPDAVLATRKKDDASRLSKLTNAQLAAAVAILGQPSRNPSEHHGVALVRGPPGTGKTVLIGSTVAEWCRSRSALAAKLRKGEITRLDAQHELDQEKLEEEERQQREQKGKKAPVAKGPAGLSASAREAASQAEGVREQVLRLLAPVFCLAPSNAAVDNMHMRIREELRSAPDTQDWQVVRLRSEAAASSTVLCDAAKEELRSVDEVLEAVCKTLPMATAKAGADRVSPASQSAHLSRLQGGVVVLGTLDLMPSLLEAAWDTSRLERRLPFQDATQLQAAIDASGKSQRTSAPGGRFHEHLREECLSRWRAGLRGGLAVVDEAAQATELQTAVPFALGCHRVALVGDERQLPPTLTSQLSQEAGADRTLFDRLTGKNGGWDAPTTTLDTQFRMHPSISSFPAARFYTESGECMMQDAPWLLERQPPQALAEVIERHGPMQLFNVPAVGRAKKNANDREVVQVVKLVKELAAAAAAAEDPQALERVGVLTFYRDQVCRLSEALKKEGLLATTGKESGERHTGVQVRTVDGFQGAELDVVILSTVRPEDGLGFVADRRRVNVALTRARHAMWLVGDAKAMEAAGCCPSQARSGAKKVQ